MKSSFETYKHTFKRTGLQLMVILAGMLCSIPVFSQLKYQISNYPVEFTKGGNQNWDIALDSENRVYFANNYGLVVFENASSTLYQLPEKTIIRSVCVVNDTIYTGSYEELGFWTRTQDDTYTYTSLVSKAESGINANDEFWQITEHNGYIYFHTFGSIYVYDRKSLWKIPSALSGFMFLYKVGNQLVTQKIGGGLYELTPKKISLLNSAESLHEEELKSIVPLNENQSFLTTSKGLYLYDHSSYQLKKLTSVYVKLAAQQKINTATRNDFYLIIGTILDGVYIFTLEENPRLLTKINTNSQLQNNTVLSLATDASQNLWVGMDKGVDYIAFNTAVDSYRHENPKVGSTYAAALLNRTLFVGSNQGIYAYEQNANGKFINGKLIKESEGQVWFLRVIDGLLYEGLNSGTFVLQQEKLIQVSDVVGAYNLKDYPGNPSIKIQSTYSELVQFKKSDGLWRKATSIRGFSSPTRFLEIDHLGMIWAGHSIKNVRRLQPNMALDSIETILTIGKDQGIHESTNRVLKLDNRIFISTSDSIFEWDSINEQFQPYTQLDNLFSVEGPIMNVVSAGNHRYWFIKKAEFILAEVRFNQIHLLYRMLPKAYNFHLIEGYERIVPISESLHVICLDDGFSIINLDQIFKTPQVTGLPKITKIELLADDKRVLDESVLKTGSRTFSNDNNSLSFYWSNPQSTGLISYFQYKLDGYDQDWSDWTPQTKISYQRLTPGTYTFNVRLFNSSGHLSNAKPYTFTIKEAWYRSGLGYLLYFIILLLITLLIRFYVSKKRWKKLGEQLERERKEIQLQTELAQKEIIALRNEKLQAEVEHKSSQLATNTMAIMRKNELLNTIKDELTQLKEELGDRFPKKYYNRIIQLIDRNLQDELEWEAFEQLFDQAHGNFFKRLKEEYPDLTPGDLRLCAYLRMNLSSKEIAPLLNISVRGVEERRYRLRKRLNLNSDTNLTEMLMTY